VSPTAPRTPTEYDDDVAESRLADLGRVGFDDAGRTVEVLVALAHETLAIAAILANADDQGRRWRIPQAPRTGSSGRDAFYRPGLNRQGCTMVPEIWPSPFTPLSTP
jgi:hypothetical protein